MSRTKTIIHLILLAVVIALLFGWLGIQPLGLEEPRRAVVAMEMDMSGDYIAPSILGEPYYKKPPVWNWVLVAAFRIFGDHSEFTIRFFSVLSFILTGLMLFWAVDSNIGRKEAWPAMLLYLTSADLFLYFSLKAEIDLFYSLLIFSMIVFIYYFLKKEKCLPLFLITYLLGAIAFLTKGMPTLLFIALSLGAAFIMEGRFRRLFSWQHAGGILLFTLIVGSYFYIYSKRSDPAGFLQVLWSESSQRTVAERPFRELVIHVIEFPLIFLKNLMPASLLLLFMFRHGRELMKHPFLRYAIVITLVNALVYWFSPGSRPPYTYMLYPLLIAWLVAGYYYEGTVAGREAKILHGILKVMAILLLAGLMAFPFIPALGGLPHRILAAGIAAVVILAGAWLFMYRSSAPLLFLVTVMIALRLLVNLSVVPSRALPANAAMKEVASGQRIAELAGDQELYIRAGYVIPLRIIYHIYKERPRIIETVQEAPPGALMITIPELTTLSDSVRMVEELQDMQGNPVWLITRTEKND